MNGVNLKIREIRELPADEISKKVVDLKKELGIEKGSATGGAKLSGKIRNLRRTIARMLCIKREKELNINQPKAKEENNIASAAPKEQATNKPAKKAKTE